MADFFRRFQLEAALLGTVLIWGANFPIFKYALASLHPHAANAFRFAVAILILGVFYRLRTTNAWAALRRAVQDHGRTLFGLSLLGYVFYQLCFVEGIARTSAASASLLMTTAPLWTAIASRILGVERLNARAWGGLLLSLAGTLIVVLGATSAAVRIDSLAGNALMLGAAVLWGLYTPFSKPLLAHVEPTAVTLIEIVMAFPIQLLIATPFLAETAWQDVSPPVIGALIYSGGLSIGLTIVVWNSAVRKVGPASTAAYNYLVPFFAAMFGFFLLGEPITGWQIVGGLVIIAGLVVMRRAKRRIVASVVV